MMSSQQASYDEADPVYTEVVRAVAREKGVDPLTLDPPLYDVLDPEALDSLYRSGRSPRTPLEVSFSYADCTVTVDDEGSVRVESRVVE